MDNLSKQKSLVALLLVGSALVGCAAPPAAAPLISPLQPTPEVIMPANNVQFSPLPVPRPATATQPMAQDLAVADLASRLSLASTAITVRQVVEVEWPDASLGCPQPGIMYAQVITPGQRIMLEANGRTYEYHAGEGRVILCRP